MAELKVGGKDVSKLYYGNEEVSGNQKLPVGIILGQSMNGNYTTKFPELDLSSVKYKIDSQYGRQISTGISYSDNEVLHVTYADLRATYSVEMQSRGVTLGSVVITSDNELKIIVGSSNYNIRVSVDEY